MGNDAKVDQISNHSLHAKGELCNRTINPDFASYREELRRFVARQLNSRQEADDVVQDIYQELLRYPAREAIRNPRAWLWRIAWRVLNGAREARRKSRAHVAVDPKVIEEWANRSSVQTATSVETQLEAADELLAALNELPVPTQIAIVRSRRDGWSLEAIAQELGVSTHMVEKHITRALTHFTALSRAKATSRKESR
jgi:RNA polymerase sigma-70 factor (ECF subfamily)